jgi:hypothetical protein
MKLLLSFAALGEPHYTDFFCKLLANGRRTYNKPALIYNTPNNHFRIPNPWMIISRYHCKLMMSLDLFRHKSMDDILCS